MAKRNLFTEIEEGFDALAQQRETAKVPGGFPENKIAGKQIVGKPRLQRAEENYLYRQVMIFRNPAIRIGFPGAWYFYRHCIKVEVRSLYEGKKRIAAYLAIDEKVKRVRY
jgi:hypothetical protein